MANPVPWRSLTLSGNKYDSQDLAGHRFVTLDGMRGVAAICVMFFHYLLSTSYHVFEHATYAVDLFFVISGIVLTHSYGSKISNGMTFSQFMKIRIIRLYPFIMIGSILGTSTFILYASWSTIRKFGLLDYVFSIVSGITILPYPNHRAVPAVGDGTLGAPLFPTNIPEWSLFFELLASIALFFVIRKRITSQYVVGFAFIMLVCALLHYRTLNLGWGMSTMPGGFPRTAFAFFSGVMLYQLFVCLKDIKVAVHPWIILGVTMMLFALPSARNMHMRVILWPILCGVGISCLIFGTLSNDHNSKTRRVFVWLGRISYGIYAIHWPLYHIIVVILNRTPWALVIRDAPLVLACVVATLVILVAHLLTSIIDEPLRRWLIAGRSTSPTGLRPA
jgi:peptidoglycan/LPS O-acetylase OafA/YrhL